MLWDSLGNFFSLNSVLSLSIMYKICAAYVQPLPAPFAAYVAFRNNAWLIAQCKWQIGQATNVLNMLFDLVDQRITITQSSTSPVSLTTFEYPAIGQTGGAFGSPPVLQLRAFGDKAASTIVTINIPAGISLTAITAVVNQIIIPGIPYQIIQS